MRPTLTATVLIVTAVFAPTAPCQSLKLTTTTKHQQEDQIRGAVLRKQMLEWVHEQGQAEAEAKSKMEADVAKQLNVKVFFVSINGKDPPDDFMKRFRDIPRIVRKVSRSQIRQDMQNAVIDGGLNLNGVIFRADSIKWLKNDSVDVEGGYFYDGLYAATEVFRLRLQRGKWIVTGSGVRRIS